jgi:hypothetical protein
MPRQSDEEESSCLVSRTMLSCRLIGASEGSGSTPSPVKEIKFQKRGRAPSQDQSALSAAHVTPILLHPALRYPFSGEGSNSIPSPVKRIQALQSKHIADEDEDEWELIAEYATNHQQAMDAHGIVDDIYRHDKTKSNKSCRAMQPDYIGKPEDQYLWYLIRLSKTCWEYACLMS